MDNTQAPRLVERLKSDIDSMPAQLKSVAKYIIDHPGDFGMDPIRVSASKIGVSPNSLVRLAQKMGYQGFDSFREPFRRALVTEGEGQLGEAWLEKLEGGDSLARNQARLGRNEVNIVARSLRMMTHERITAALGYMTEARHCYITATRSSYALASYFHYVGRMALPELQLIPRHMGSAVDELIHATEMDCLIAITFSPYSAETIGALRYAQARKTRLIVLSDSEAIAPHIRPDVVFPVATHSHHSFGCYSGAMAVLDCLLGHLVAAGGAEAQRRITDYEATREDSGAYWKAPRNPRLRN